MGHQLGVVRAGHEERRADSIDQNDVLSARICDGRLLVTHRSGGKTAQDYRWRWENCVNCIDNSMVEGRAITKCQYLINNYGRKKCVTR